MIWGIIAALETEISAICNAMEDVESTEIYGSTYYKGTIKNQTIVAVCSSIGTINAAVCASIIIREFKVECVINLGIAGSACDELNIMDVVISDDLVFHDVDLEMIAKYYPFRKSFPTDENLRLLALEAIQSMQNRSFAWKVGRIATGDCFVQSFQDKQRIIKKCSPLCIEMEGAAIAQVAFINRIPVLVIRTLADDADENAEKTYDEFLNEASKTSSAIFLNMINIVSKK